VRTSGPRLALFGALLIVAFALAALAVRARHASAGPLRDGDRVVFFGDSITAQGVAPSGYVTLIRNRLAEEHPAKGVEVIGAGIPGNKIADLLRRLDGDVLARKPTLVVVYIGINDVLHGERDPRLGTLPDDFEAGLHELIRRIKASGARVLLCTPSVVGERADGSNFLDQRLDQYADISRKVATGEQVPLCDLREAFIAWLRAHNLEGIDRGVLTTDRVHLNEAGNRLVADTILAALGA
jgi:lysophospholipase L1-like esterase